MRRHAAISPLMPHARRYAAEADARRMSFATFRLFAEIVLILLLRRHIMRFAMMLFFQAFSYAAIFAITLRRRRADTISPITPSFHAYFFTPLRRLPIRFRLRAFAAATLPLLRFDCHFRHFRCWLMS
jgi:hypothetical protein